VLAYVWASQSHGAVPGCFPAHKIFAALLLMAAFGVLGLVDDYLTVHPRGGVRGIASKPKALIQIVLATLFMIWLAGQETPTLYLGAHGVLMGIGYCIFAVLYIVGMANFVNITDGLDGLASGLAAIAAAAFCIIVSVTVSSSDAMSVVPLICALAGASVAFLWFNANPARIFMGDTGALALGAVLPAVAILAHREVLMVIVGMVFVLDGLSTAIQWAVFKFTRITTGTGRRIFKKSPIHHHFELSGWPEQQIVIRFWIVGIICAVVGYAGAWSRLW